MKKISILLIAIFTSIQLFSQSTLTIGEVFDFDINDEFQYKFHNKPPNAERIIIIGKYFSFSNDTVFYIIQSNNYYTMLNYNPYTHLDYYFNNDIDTINFTNLNSPVNSLFINHPAQDTAISGNSFTDTNYISTTYCGKQVYEFNACLHCIFEGNSYKEIYGKGIGRAYVYSFIGVGIYETIYYLSFFKKGNIICGIPDSTTQSVNNDFIENKFTFYPNPANNILTLDLSQLQKLQNTTVSIYDIQGKQLLHQNISEELSQLDISAFAKGIYIIKVQSDKEILQSKFVKN